MKPGGDEHVRELTLRSLKHMIDQLTEKIVSYEVHPPRAAMTGVEMDMFQVKVNVADPQSTERSFKEPFWVDTERMYSFAPKDRLRAIGLAPAFTADFVFADGKTDRRLVGEAAFSIEGSNETITCLVVFGPPTSLFLLGTARWRISASRSIQPRRSSARSRPSSGRLGRVDAACRGSRARQ